MSSLPKCRRVKRPTILTKRSQLAKKNLYKKRSYKPLYEKVKHNNNALAKALSKEKQECQYLFTENLALTSEVQELAVACNKRDDVISGVLKNAKDTLALLVTLTNHVTNTIASCQQVVVSTRFAPGKSPNTNERRDGNRRLSSKSPARGVVQPMVSGHTITKPTINLSRLNIQREYRVQNAPNLSDIDEAATTPEHSPPSVQPGASVHIALARPLSRVPRRIDRMPERLQHSLRTSDESERRSSGGGSRNSGRLSLRRSRRDSEAVRPEVSNDERLKSPRVSLHDVSRLLQNAQSVNIRTLLENSCDMELTQPQQPEEQTAANTPVLDRVESSSKRPSNSPSPGNEASSSLLSSPGCCNDKKETSPACRASDDPLEGPSWLLNDSEVASSSDVSVSPHTEGNGKETRKMNETSLSDASSTGVPAEKDEAENKRIAEAETEEDDEDYVERRANIGTRWAHPDSNFYRNLNNDDERTDTNLPNFVTRKRGSHCDDTEDFTLMWRRPAAKNYNFDINDLELPVIDSPIVKAPVARPPEPELTTNVQIITTQNFGNLTSVCPPIGNQNVTIVDSPPFAPPPLPENPNVFGSSVIEQNEASGDENEPIAGKRKRRRNKPVSLPESPNESDWMPTPKRPNSKEKRKQKTKDPSSAKVVLRKLKEDRLVKASTSPEMPQSQESESLRGRSGSSVGTDPPSDSEISNASSKKLTSNAEVQGRPRRQKAPKNLQEPSLGKKLRRN